MTSNHCRSVSLSFHALYALGTIASSDKHTSWPAPAAPIAWSQGYNDPMTQQASELLQKALSLSEEERAELAGSLIESLDATVDEAADAAWNQEIARRIEDLDSANATTIPCKEVRSRISAKLTHGK